MTDPSSFDPKLLDAYLAGELSPDQRVQVDAWLATRDVTAQLVRELPMSVLGEARAVNTDASWRQLAARIHGSAGTDDLAVQRDLRAASSRGRQMSPLLRRITQIAAALVLVVGGVAAWRTTRGGGRIEAPLGRERTAVLPDGTRLTVGAGSRVAWSAAYGHGARDVTLDGQASFDVVHDASRPFRVHARDAVAEDIGTRFAMRAWPELTAVEVAVQEGSVALAAAQAHADAGTVVRAGQLGRLGSNGQVAVTTAADVATAWARGQLAFENSPLAEVLPAISRRFGVDLRADPALTGRRLSAHFDTQSLPELLNVLAVSLDVRVETRGRTIMLLPTLR